MTKSIQGQLASINERLDRLEKFITTDMDDYTDPMDNFTHETMRSSVKQIIHETTSISVRATLEVEG